MTVLKLTKRPSPTAPLTRHGMSYSREYRAWHQMRERCFNHKNKSFGDYGGRGIAVCDQWRDFDRFYLDMGKAPEGASLDRINNNADYAPGNCRWATREQQARNKRTTHWLTFHGETKCLTEWAASLGIKPRTLRARLDDHGWTVEKALTTPVLSSRTKTRYVA